MSAPTRLPLRQGTPEWVAARRDFVTATDIGVILGLNPWRCEADLADEKLNGTAQEPSLAMRLGSALEPFIASEYTAQTGREVRRVHGLWRHPTVTWAAASPDWQVVGERRLVEGKTTGSRSRFADGVPDDIRAQTAWQMFVADVPVVDVAVLVGNQELAVFEVRRDRDLEADLVAVAADFRRRLEAGGPFARSEERIRRDHPADDGTEITADNDTAEAVRALLDIRAHIARMEADEKRLKAAIEARMGDAAVMTGPGFRVVWKRTKDRTEQDWRAIAEEAIAPLAEIEREQLIGRHVIVRAGMRPLRVTSDKETE